MAIPRNATTTEESVHVDKKLIDLARGAWQPTQSELKGLIAHYSICMHCKLVYQQLQAAQKDSQQYEERAGEFYNSRLLEIARAVYQVHDFNIIGAYADMLEREGEEQANHSFPILAKHLKLCKACQEDLRAVSRAVHNIVDEGPPSPTEIQPPHLSRE